MGLPASNARLVWMVHAELCWSSRGRGSGDSRRGARCGSRSFAFGDLGARLGSFACAADRRTQTRRSTSNTWSPPARYTCIRSTTRTGSSRWAAA